MRSEIESRFLNELVLDCITFRLRVDEALAYIQHRFGKPIARASYLRRRGLMESNKGIENWLNYFTRVGFVQLHKELLDNARMLLKDSNRRLITEMSQDSPNEFRIRQLKAEIHDEIYQCSELSLGTPIVAQIRAKLAEKTDLTNKQNQQENEKLV